MHFKLGTPLLNDTKKSVKALKAHILNESQSPQPVYFTINVKRPLAKLKDYTPRVIPITNALDKLENKSVLLVTKDPSTPYRNLLTEKDSPTEDVFNQIFTLTKLKRMALNHRKISNLFKEFDVVVADHRVHKFLPEILGVQFYQRNKKLPFVIQMAPPDPNAKLVKTSKSHKLKDERCEPKYVKGQMNSIAKNTFCIIPANGTFMSIKIGYSDWNTDKLITNINDVLVYLLEKRYPSGGFLTKSMIESIHIKTSESISLPIYKYVEEPESESDTDLD